jgi:hypothetical protein
MRIKHTDSELRAILVMHWKQKLNQIVKRYIVCSFKNKFCDTCKEAMVCKRIAEKPWIGKI